MAGKRKPQAGTGTAPTPVRNSLGARLTASGDVEFADGLSRREYLHAHADELRAAAHARLLAPLDPLDDAS